jgi:hypothetical protein
MTEKRFELIWETDEMCNVFDNDLNVNSTLSVEEVVDLLNNQDMQIFLLKCVIQTITAESMDKNISHKRILEIKKHWYDKLYGDLE